MDSAAATGRTAASGASVASAPQGTRGRQEAVPSSFSGHEVTLSRPLLALCNKEPGGNQNQVGKSPALTSQNRAESRQR